MTVNSLTDSRLLQSRLTSMVKSDEELKSINWTRTELKVLGLFDEGTVSSSQGAADYLVVSKRTIDFHFANIFEKADVHNRTEALYLYRRLYSNNVNGQPYSLNSNGRE